MTALAADKTDFRELAGGDLRRIAGTLTAAANAVLWHGALGAKGGTGGAFVTAATAAGGQVIGYNAGQKVDNTGGADGAKDVNDLSCGRVLLKNGTAAITNADVGKLCFVQDDQTVQRTGAVPAGIVWEVVPAGVYVYVDPVVTAAVAGAAIASNQTAAGTPVVYVFAVPDAATGDIDIVVDRKIEVFDVVCQKQNGAGAANTMQIKNAATAISDAIACATDNAVTRAGTIDDAQSTINAGGTLRLTATRAAGTRNALVIVHALTRV